MSFGIGFPVVVQCPSFRAHCDWGLCVVLRTNETSTCTNNPTPINIILLPNAWSRHTVGSGVVSGRLVTCEFSVERDVNRGGEEYTMLDACEDSAPILSLTTLGCTIDLRKHAGHHTACFALSVPHTRPAHSGDSRSTRARPHQYL